MASGIVLNGMGHSRHARASSPRAAQEPLDVLGDHVDLEVHGRPAARPAGSSRSSVYGMSATVKAPRARPATVSEIPSTATEPFSTR